MSSFSRNTDSTDSELREETGLTLGFTERTFNLTGNERQGFCWKFDDDHSNVYHRVWKTEKGAIKFIKKRTKRMFLVRTKI